jgi:hypothetical protein
VGGYPRRPSGGPAAFIADEGAASSNYEGRQSLGTLPAIQAEARLGTPASSLSDEMPLGLEKGIVMMMSRNAGSMKNDKKFNMRESVIDTETTDCDPLAGHRVVEISTVQLVHLRGRESACR